MLLLLLLLLLLNHYLEKKHMMDKKSYKTIGLFLKEAIEMLQRVISTAEFLKIEFDVKWLLLEDCILPRSW